MFIWELSYLLNLLNESHLILHFLSIPILLSLQNFDAILSYFETVICFH